MNIDPAIRERLGLKEVNQIGIVVRDLEKAIDYYRKLGFGPFLIAEPDYWDKTYRGRPGDFRIRFAQFMIGSLEVEVVQQVAGRSIYDEFLERNGEGLHHLGFKVTNMDEKIKEFAEMGIEVLQSGRREIARWAYMDTEAIGGVIFELYERFKEQPIGGGRR